MHAWRARMNCQSEGCIFVVYIEGEPTEAGTDEVVAFAMTAHFSINHPGEQPNIRIPDAQGEVSPPNGALDPMPHGRRLN